MKRLFSLLSTLIRRSGKESPSNTAGGEAGWAKIYYPTLQDKENYKALSVCILSPCGSGYMRAEFARSLANMISYSWHQGLKIFQVGITTRTVVDWARNALAREAKDYISEYTGERFTHLLWLDDDMVFNPDLACFLIKRPELDMVSALYYGREKPLPVVYTEQFEGEGDKYKHHNLVNPPEHIFACAAVGFGAMMMRRDVLDRVPEPWFTIDWRAGEDIAFCVKAREYGITVWCEGGYTIGHIGDPRVVTRDSYLEYIRTNMEETAPVYLRGLR